MNEPTGLVTFLFTDIEGSTKLSQNFPDTLQSSLDRHYEIMNKAVESNNGFVFEIVGDAYCCAFEKAEDAVKAAVEAQINLSQEKWDEAVINIRIGIHSGNAEWDGKRYMGYITLARTARVMSAAYGEQIIISNNAYDLCKYEFASVKENNISFRDLGERRLKDVIQPVRLFQITSPGLREEFPPLKTLDARPNNLPVQLTNFIGREKEMAEIKKLFSNTRLVTLIGTGGTGKTRIALQIAADMIDEFKNGAWLVELAPLFDENLIPLTIARSLGAHEQPGQDTDITLLNFLKDKEILIILDNCEHLINSCAHTAEMLLQKCAGLKIIATSREALRSEGELTHRVSPLEHPEPKSKNTPIELSQFEAVRLFIERAIAVNTGFRVTNDNAPALAQICYQLGGIPLAIELAASRTRILSVEKICEKLDNRFKFLTGGKRTALPRHQTLKAMIDWSYDLLTEKEKLLFQKLSAFTGGWTLEAAEDVCSDDIIDSYEIIDVQTNLLDKSLISSDEGPERIRFDMLESIKQYAKELPDADKEVARKHLNYFRRLSDHEKMRQSGMEQIEWLQLIESEIDNIRSAIHWATENETDEALILVNDMIEFWNVKGYFLEALQSCLKLIEIDFAVDEFLKAKVIYSAGLISQHLGRSADALKFIKEALIVFRKSDSKAEIAKCLNVLGVANNTHFEKGNEALEYFNEAISIFRELDMKKDMGNTLYNISFVYNIRGDNELALKSKIESLNIFKEINDTHHFSLVLANLGIFEFKNNNFEKALSYTQESLSMSQQIGDSYLISINLINLACIYSGLEKFDKAFKLLEEALLIIIECGYKSSYLVAVMYQGEVSSKLGDEENAIGLFKKSILSGTETGIDYYLANNLYRLGISHFNIKDYESSLKYFSFMKTLGEMKNNPLGREKLDHAEEYKNKLKEVLGIDKYTELSNEVSGSGKEEAIIFALNNMQST